MSRRHGLVFLAVVWWASALISAAAVFHPASSLPQVVVLSAGLPLIVLTCAAGLLHEPFSPGHPPVSHAILTFLAMAAYLVLLVSSAVAAFRPARHGWRRTSLLMIPIFIALGIAVVWFVWSRLGL